MSVPTRDLQTEVCYSKNIFLVIPVTPGSPGLVPDLDKIRCEVQDNGQGLSAEDIKKLFGKFTRLSARPTGGESSSGLGLSIAKKFADATNARIWAESDGFNKGTGLTKKATKFNKYVIKSEINLQLIFYTFFNMSMPLCSVYAPLGAICL